nr:hypothetical protein [Francisella orientalis]
MKGWIFGDSKSNNWT